MTAQTVTFAGEIHTVSTDADTDPHYIDAEKEVTIDDAVEYHSPDTEMTYIVRGTLMDRATGEPMVDGNGLLVTSESEPFTPAPPDGQITIDFDFLAYRLNGAYTVAFEYLYEVGDDGSEKPIASHEDLVENEWQTVELLKPTLWTDAGQTDTGENQIDATDSVETTDMLDITSLIIGHTYYVYGKAVTMDGEIVHDASTGEPVELYMMFVADAPEMELDIMQFVFDATGLDGQAIVFKEYMYADADRTIHITEEEDLGAMEQTIYFNTAPSIGTTLLDGRPAHTGQPRVKA